MVRTQTHLWRWALIAGCAVGLAGCSLTPRIVERTPDAADKVGSVGVAVVSVAPFELFAKDLQPNFDINGEKALELATASTRQVEDSYVQSLQALLKLAPEQLSGKRDTNSSTDAAGKTTVTASSSGSAQAGELSKVGGPTVPAGALPGVLEGGRAPAGINPMLSYLLATAVLQEVKLLNKYVRSAPKLQEHTPFIVRLQLNVRQFGRNTPYDAQVDINFGSKIVAVPLLVSDSIDIASASTARNTIRSLGVGLAALRGNFGLGLDAGSRTEQLLRALGSEFNSVLTVGQTPNNRHSVTVHIGASEKDVDKHELLTRSHLVTVMLLVHDSLLLQNKCDGLARTATASFTPTLSFRHARTGEPLPSGTEPQKAITFQIQNWPEPRMPGQQLARLELSGDEAPYAGVVELRGGDGLVRQMFDRVCLRGGLVQESPSPAPASCPPSRQAVADTFCVGHEALQASSFEVVDTSGRDTLKAKFELLDFTDKTLKAGATSLTQMCFDTVARHGVLTPGRGGCVPVTGLLTKPDKPSPKLGAAVNVGETRLIADREGRASLSVSVAFPPREGAKAKTRPAQVHIEVAGAGLLAAEPVDAKASCVSIGAALIVSDDCAFVLRLKNAAPGQAVTVSAKARRPDVDGPVKLSSTSLEVVLQAPEMAVLLPAVKTAPLKP